MAWFCGYARRRWLMMADRGDGTICRRARGVALSRISPQTEPRKMTGRCLLIKGRRDIRGSGGCRGVDGSARCRSNAAVTSDLPNVCTPTHTHALSLHLFEAQL